VQLLSHDSSDSELSEDYRAQDPAMLTIQYNIIILPLAVAVATFRSECKFVKAHVLHSLLDRQCVVELG